jgi:hypothetical protein
VAASANRALGLVIAKCKVLCGVTFIIISNVSENRVTEALYTLHRSGSVIMLIYEKVKETTAHLPIRVITKLPSSLKIIW